MFFLLYKLPLWLVIYAMFVVTLLYTFINHKIKCYSYKYKKCLKIFNMLLFVISVIAAFYLTVLSREGGIHKLVLTPFESIKVCRYQPEMLRSLLMNIALFFPFGLSLSSILQDKFSVVKNISCTAVAGFFLSVMIEAIQYFCSLGEAWTDDVICNTLGAFLGTMHLLAIAFYNLLKTKQKNEQ